ncbi:MAG: hypothetical protein BMS9Abin28_0471 [Anaerolineae bacterium]|nr:MAG: hypothetical protein BMS9Abin28_0471 [Anaerolineae bacterium]
MVVMRALGVAWLSLSTLLSLMQQVPGFAEITEPMQGQSVTGIVTISGTASHPAFESFDLAFSFDPDPTDTWFPIGEALDTPVVDGRLAIWDTIEITDGVYRLRLRVNVEGSPPFETVIGGVRVRNYTPTETPPPAAVGALPTSAATPAPTLQPEPELEDEPPSRFSSALKVGIFLGLFLMLASAIYVRLAPRVRAYTGYLRMRQLHRRQDRARQRGRRRE